MYAIPHRGQEKKDPEVPEEELDQEGDVAKDFDVDAGDLPEEPVGGKPRDAQKEAQHGGQHDAKQRHLDSVQYPHQEGVPEEIRLLVVDDGLRYGEPRLLLQEVKSQGQPPLIGGVEDVADREKEEGKDDDYGDYLGDPTQYPDIPPHGNAAIGEEAHQSSSTRNATAAPGQAVNSSLAGRGSVSTRSSEVAARRSGRRRPRVR